MSNIVKRKNKEKKLKRNPVGLLLIVLAWSLAMGWLLALATNVNGATPTTSSIGTVDVVPTQFKLGQEVYLENCSTCHIALPPSVFPTQTWKNLIQDPEHYGSRIQPLVDPQRVLVWRYLSAFSRPLLEDESTPYRLNSSRYFKALHPQVKLPNPVQASGCVTCHPGANNYNFRSLSTEWQ
jgi:Dihaem cytochrome c